MNLHAPYSSGLHGRVENVFISGFNARSLSLIPTNPATEDPSNNNPSSIIVSTSSGLFKDTATFFGNPCISTNWNLKNFEPCSSTVLTISSILLILAR